MKPREKLRQLRKELKQERREKAEMITVLKYYGDEKNYSWYLNRHSIPVADEGGQSARAMLEKIDRKKGEKLLKYK